MQNRRRELIKIIKYLRVRLLTISIVEVSFLLAVLLLLSYILLSIYNKLVNENYYYVIPYLLPLFIILLVIYFINHARRYYRLEKIAFLLEKKFNYLRNDIISSLQLTTNIDYSAKIYSARLIEALLNNTVEKLKRVDLNSVISKKRLKKIVHTTIILLFITGGLYAIPLSLPLQDYNRESISPQRIIKKVQKKEIVPLVISDIKFVFIYPRYTKLEKEIVKPTSPLFYLPYGTKIIISANVNKEVKEAFISEKDKKTMMQINNNRISGVLNVYKDTEFSIEVKDAATGNINKAEFKYLIKVIKDEAPSICIVEPKKDLIKTDTTPVNIKLEATDDYGISRVMLKYKRSSHPYWVTKKLKIVPDKALYLNYNFDLAALLPLKEEVFTYYFVAYDNDEFNPKKAQTNIYKITFTEKEVKEVNLQEKIEDVLSKQDKLKSDIKELHKKLLKGGKLHPTDKKILQEVVFKQQQINELTETINKEIEKIRDEAQTSTEILTKLTQISKILNEILDEHSKEIIRKLQEVLKKVELTDIEKELYEIALSQEELLKRLETTLNLLKLAKLEKELRELSEKVKEMVDEQQKINISTKRIKSKEDEMSFKEKAELYSLAYRENILSKEIEKLEKKLGELAQEIYPDNRNMAHNLLTQKEFIEKKQLYNRLKEIERNLQDMKLNEAISAQETLLNDLFLLSENLTQTEAQFFSELHTQLMKDFNYIFNKVLYLSFKEEEITKELNKLVNLPQDKLIKDYKQKLQELTSKQLKIEQGINNLGKKVTEASKTNFMMLPSLSLDITKIRDIIQAAAFDIQGGNLPSAYNLTNRAVSELNRMLKKLAELGKETEQLSYSAALREYLKRLESIINRHKHIKGLTKGMCPLMRMPLSAGGLSHLKMLAAEQQELIRQMEALSKLLKADKIGRGFQEIIEEEKEIEGEIIKGNIDKKLVDKQTKVLHKLLEFQASLYKRGVEEKRISYRPKEYKIEKEPKEIETKKTLLKLKEPQYREYPIRYRKIIKDYFRRLYDYLQNVP